MNSAVLKISKCRARVTKARWQRNRAMRDHADERMPPAHFLSVRGVLSSDDGRRLEDDVQVAAGKHIKQEEEKGDAERQEDGACRWVGEAPNGGRKAVCSQEGCAVRLGCGQSTLRA